ncbi:alpha/beta hydrolase [Cyclobacterium plantarum]|uniref:alpha/beta hydrolase n=1 Tax=Cyclobacterium plantarum TaxID=2716263 RepID=UPI003F6EF3DE
MEGIIKTGKDLTTADKIAILVHGRGATAGSLLGLADALALDDFAILAPQAPGNTWYPYGFMAPEKENEPHLSQSLEIINNLVRHVLDQKKDLDQLYFIGFSQGACLSLEFVARHPARYGGVIAFTGGLIGESLSPYEGDLKGTPVFIGASLEDFHVPYSRIKETERMLTTLGARVKAVGFPDRFHSIREEEILAANQFVLNF